MPRIKKPKVQIRRQKTSLGWAYRIYIDGHYTGTGLTLAYAPVEERRRPRWELWRVWRTFPGSNGLHYNLDPRQCTLDFTLHAGNLGIQKRLQFLEFGR